MPRTDERCRETLPAFVQVLVLRHSLVPPLVNELIQMVREKIGPVASFKVATIVKRLPKTRSGKIVRGTIKKLADGVEYRMPPTIEDPTVIDEIKLNLSAIGYPRS
ncbi:MAG: hypothetical protein LC794_02600 [Acidobacteria bacterium]|nr:hypothetical protein [Acidobacteriota bacterium]